MKIDEMCRKLDLFYPLLQVAFCPFMAPGEAKLEEECFAPCEKVPSSTWSYLGGPRGEVQWGSGSP